MTIDIFSRVSQVLKESNLHKKMGHKYDTKIHERN